MTPKRIQRRRTRGWRMPDGAVYVGRPTKWGNPFSVQKYGEIAAEYFEAFVTGEMVPDIALADYRAAERAYYGNAPALLYPAENPAWLEPLRGRDLVCWCPLDQPCHADVLLELANR